MQPFAEGFQPASKQARHRGRAAFHVLANFRNGETAEVMELDGGPLVLGQTAESLGQPQGLLMLARQVAERRILRLAQGFQLRRGALHRLRDERVDLLSTMIVLSRQIGDLVRQDRAQPGLSLGLGRTMALIPLLTRL